MFTTILASESEKKRTKERLRSIMEGQDEVVEGETEVN